MRGIANGLRCGALAFVVGVALTEAKTLILQPPSSPPSVAVNLPVSTSAQRREQLTLRTHESGGPTDFYIDEDQWNYQGYLIERKSRRVRLDEGDPSLRWFDVSYIAITKDEKLVAKFDADVYFGLGNSADFAVFPFLGGDTKQLFISQDVPRGGCQWVASVNPRFRVIFDGEKFEVGREGYDFETEDLDNDGIYEIIVPLTRLYGFSNLSPAATPLPSIIFKYDQKRQEYLPVNPLFRDYLLGTVDDQKSTISPADADDPMQHHLSDVMSITLDYIFAGEERQAWTFFDESYKLRDKKAVKAKIKAEIKDHPVYRFIYRKTAVR